MCLNSSRECPAAVVLLRFSWCPLLDHDRWTCRDARDHALLHTALASMDAPHANEQHPNAVALHRVSPAGDLATVRNTHRPIQAVVNETADDCLATDATRKDEL